MVVCAGFALCDDNPASRQPPVAPRKEDVTDHQRFCVTIWPAKTQVAPDEEFELKVRVVNSTEETQSLQVWNCSWDSHWTWSNQRFGYVGWGCGKNFVTSVPLAPGEAYEKTFKAFLAARGESKTQSLRLGFTPEGEQKTYWSNEVVLGMK
jgi:hypothetical protein